ncbi:MAG: hypothetical protein HFK09_07105 [Clostridia bacterium]|nr:hypothetical protein [Clostridia bacterium]
MNDRKRPLSEAVKDKVVAVREKGKARIAKVKGSIVAKKAASPNTVANNRLELMITIVNRSKAEYYADLIQSFDVNMQVMALASGTADAKMLAYFGLSDSDKTVIFSVIQENKISDAFASLEEKFATIKNGKGIAYTIPLTSVIGTLIFGFLSNNRMAVKE